MDILSALLNAQGGGATRQLGQQFGLNEDQVGAALSALVPALAAGVQRNTSSQGGLDDLLGALTGGSHQQYVDDPSSLSRQETVQDGNNILGHIFGSKDVSRQVATQAAAQTGIGADILKQMLPMIAAMMMGAMSKRATNPPSGMQAGAGGGLLDMLSPMLDANRDGSAVDDIVGSVGKWLGSTGR
jgi:hypothetical protein